MQKIKEISTQETFAVRQPVLRPGKPIESCHFDGDSLPTTKHFGLFFNDHLAGIISVFEAQCKLFDNQKQKQIRGMAVLDNYKKKGFGAALVKHCENYCRQEKTDLIWFNARANAIGFYEKMGYLKKGSSFEIPNVGKHTIMFKVIQNE